MVDGQYYFVMEFVDGTSFKEVIRSPEYTVRQKLDILIGVLKGLDYAHKNGVIHRDVKPANILIDKQGYPQIADFGVAQILNNTDQDVTRSDVIMGTLAYMSPEQRVSSAHVELTTDIFSVGVILYEILTGNRPVGKFKPASEFNPKVPREFDDIIERCLAMDPKERFQSAVELKDEILNVISARSGKTISPKSNISGVESFIGKCQFLDTIKETKYSTTYLVENRDTRELYVIKKNDRSPAGLKEARILSKLKNENIVNIFGAGGDQRRFVCVMEYAQGGSLADRMVKKYPPDKATPIISDIASALQFAHRNGVVHGDLRPSNVLFTKEEIVRVTDFGLPPHYNLMEKNWYAAPEKRVSKQADIYSLGVILHNLLYGTNPSYDRNAHLILGRTTDGIPARLEAILKKMLAFKIAARYQDFEEFYEDWKLMEDSQYARRVRRSYADKPATTIHKFLKNTPLKVAAAIGIIAVLTFLFLYFGDVIR